MLVKVGDLSAPVLAIIVTIGLIAAGLVLMSWFWWFAPTIARTGFIAVVGQPTLINKTSSSPEQYRLVIAIKNLGNDVVKIEGITIKNGNCSNVNDLIEPGDTKVFQNIICTVDLGKDEYIVDGVIITNAGTFRFSASVI